MHTYMRAVPRVLGFKITHLGINSIGRRKVAVQKLDKQMNFAFLVRFIAANAMKM